MNLSSQKLLSARKEIGEEIKRLLSSKQAPIVVALDGGSGAGKSTLASIVESEFDTAMIPLDDFFSADIPDPKWDDFTVEEKLRNVFDWEQLLTRVIEPLLEGKAVSWHAFDFASGLRPDGTYGLEEEPKERDPADVILIEGAYSASPELAVLVDLAILVDVPLEARHARLLAREDRDFLETWHKRWDEVESYYFNEVRSKSSFDLIIEPDYGAPNHSLEATGDAVRFTNDVV